MTIATDWKCCKNVYAKTLTAHVSAVQTEIIFAEQRQSDRTWRNNVLRYWHNKIIFTLKWVEIYIHYVLYMLLTLLHSDTRLLGEKSFGTLWNVLREKETTEQHQRGKCFVCECIGTSFHPLRFLCRCSAEIILVCTAGTWEMSKTQKTK